MDDWSPGTSRSMSSPEPSPGSSLEAEDGDNAKLQYLMILEQKFRGTQLEKVFVKETVYSAFEAFFKSLNKGRKVVTIAEMINERVEVFDAVIRRMELDPDCKRRVTKCGGIENYRKMARDLDGDEKEKWGERPEFQILADKYRRNVVVIRGFSRDFDCDSYIASSYPVEANDKPTVYLVLAASHYYCAFAKDQWKSFENNELPSMPYPFLVDEVKRAVVPYKDEEDDKKFFGFYDSFPTDESEFLDDTAGFDLPSERVAGSKPAPIFYPEKKTEVKCQEAASHHLTPPEMMELDDVPGQPPTTGPRVGPSSAEPLIERILASGGTKERDLMSKVGEGDLSKSDARNFKENVGYSNGESLSDRKRRVDNFARLTSGLPPKKGEFDNDENEKDVNTRSNVSQPLQSLDMNPPKRMKIDNTPPSSTTTLSSFTNGSVIAPKKPNTLLSYFQPIRRDVVSARTSAGPSSDIPLLAGIQSSGVTKDGDPMNKVGKGDILRSDDLNFNEKSKVGYSTGESANPRKRTIEKFDMLTSDPHPQLRGYDTDQGPHKLQLQLSLKEKINNKEIERKKNKCKTPKIAYFFPKARVSTASSSSPSPKSSPSATSKKAKQFVIAKPEDKVKKEQGRPSKKAKEPNVGYLLRATDVDKKRRYCEFKGNDGRTNYACIVEDENGQVCDQKCDRFIQIEDHLLSIHPLPGAIPIPCPQCSKTFVSPMKLRAHVNGVHRANKFVCDFNGCKSSFSDSSNFKVHQRTHFSSTYLPCVFDDCTFSAKQSRHLEYHISATHEGKRYRCTQDDCTSLFTQESDLKKHLNTALSHNQEGKFPCTTCDYKATEKGSLKIHQNRKSRSCPACKKEFKCVGQLKCHLYDECTLVPGMDKHAFMRFVCARGKEAEKRIMPHLFALQAKTPAWKDWRFVYSANSAGFPFPNPVREGEKKGVKSCQPDCIVYLPDGRVIVVEFKTISVLWLFPAREAILHSMGWELGVIPEAGRGLVTTSSHVYKDTIATQLHSVPNAFEHWILLFTAGPDEKGDIAFAKTSKDHPYFKARYDYLVGD